MCVCVSGVATGSFTTTRKPTESMTRRCASGCVSTHGACCTGMSLALWLWLWLWLRVAVAACGCGCLCVSVCLCLSVCLSLCLCACAPVPVPHADTTRVVAAPTHSYARSLRQHIKEPDLRSIIASQMMQAPRRHTRRASFVARADNAGDHHSHSDHDDEEEEAHHDTARPASSSASLGSPDTGASGTKGLAARRLRRGSHAVKATNRLRRKHHVPAWLSRARAEWVPLVQAVAAGRPRLLSRLPKVVGAPRPSHGHPSRTLSFRNSPGAGGASSSGKDGLRRKSSAHRQHRSPSRTRSGRDLASSGRGSPGLGHSDSSGGNLTRKGSSSRRRRRKRSKSRSRSKSRRRVVANEPA